MNKFRNIRCEASRSDSLKKGREEENEKERRFEIVPLTEKELIRLLEHYVVLPEDVEFHHAFFDEMCGGLMLCLKSSKFKPVPPGQNIPVSMTIRKVIK